MLQILDCVNMDGVWNYAMAPYNRPHFTRLIHKLQSTADYIVDEQRLRKEKRRWRRRPCPILTRTSF